MKIIVPVKKVVDYNVIVRPTTDGKQIDLSNIKMGMNPFDEIALEEAVRLKERGIAEKIILITIGNKNCEDILRSGLAMGADEANLIISNENYTPIQIANILFEKLKSENADLVIMGKQAIDDDCNQTGQMLASLANLPQATFASKVEINENKNQIIVTREIDSGIQKVSMKVPALITVDLRLNEPRYISLPNIMRAKKKTIQKIPIEDLNLKLESGFEILEIFDPEKREKGITVKDEVTLIHELKHTSKVI